MRPGFALLLLTTACAARPAAPTTPVHVAAPPVPRRVLITIDAGSIDGKKADGSPWDEAGAPVLPAPAAGPLATYLGAHPELDGTERLLGEPVQAPGLLEAARRSSAADPMVLVGIDPLVFRTPVAASQFQPVWRYPLVVWLVPGSHQVVRLIVADWDGPGQYDIIGSKDIPVDELLAAGRMELGRFGNVLRLTVEAQPAPAPAAARRVSVAARDAWTLTGVQVLAGQEVEIRATGEVCTRGSDLGRCAGAEGQPTAAQGNAPGFAAGRHGALIGAIGDARFLVGRERRFVAPSSGVLLLGLNDADPGDNSGELEVSVEVK